MSQVGDRLERLRAARLYGITVSSAGDLASLVANSEAALRGGVEILQLRQKGADAADLLKAARALRALTLRFGALFIVNDHAAIASASDADGVHVGQDDGTVEAARAVVGPGRIVGVSTHAPDQARKAIDDGADYIGVGPVFATPTKAGRAAVTLDYVRAVAAMNPPIPFFAIGGIDETNLESVLDAGAGRVAVVRAVFSAGDPERAARGFREALQKRPLGGLDHP